MFTFDDSEQIGDFSIQKCRPRFAEWSGPMPNWWEGLSQSYQCKRLLDQGGKPLFAEFAILQELRSTGWNGCWRDNWGRRFREEMVSPQGMVLPKDAQEQFDRIVRQNGGRTAGCWDVFVWKKGRFGFYEAKRRGKDRIRETQRNWLRAALRVGMKATDFGVVEWELE